MRKRNWWAVLAVSAWVLFGATPWANVARAQSVTLLDTTGTTSQTVANNPRGSGYLAGTHTIQMTAGSSYTIRTKTGTTIGQPASAPYDTYLYLLNPSGTSVASDDDSNGPAYGGDGGTYSSKITYTPTVSGNYTIIVTTFSSGVNLTYEVIVTGPPSTGPAPAGAIPNVRLDLRQERLRLDRTTLACAQALEPAAFLPTPYRLQRVSATP